mmetsp:Transcript_7567/g.15406  ORF Transcript_7567/g.15406 Transcript_7567/m.15406 type:complete len:213 (-) Transcript_7567:830-1468(-)
MSLRVRVPAYLPMVSLETRSGERPSFTASRLHVYTSTLLYPHVRGPSRTPSPSSPQLLNVTRPLTLTLHVLTLHRQLVGGRREGSMLGEHGGLVQYCAQRHLLVADWLLVIFLRQGLVVDWLLVLSLRQGLVVNWLVKIFLMVLLICLRVWLRSLIGVQLRLVSHLMLVVGCDWLAGCLAMTLQLLDKLHILIQLQAPIAVAVKASQKLNDL